MCSLLALPLGCSARVFLHMEGKPLGENAVFYEGGGGNAVALFHGREAFLVDAKLMDFAQRLQRAVEAPEGGAGREVKRIMLTHAHADHVNGLSRFEHLGAVIVHVNCKKRLLAEEKDWLRAQPYVEVEEAINLELGAESVHIFHPGRGHTDGDLAAYLPRRKLLIAGDLWNNGFEPEADPRYGGDIRALGYAYDRLLLHPFEVVLPGHGGSGTRAELQKTRDYLKAMEDGVVAAVAQGMSEEQTVASVTLAQWPDYIPIPVMANRKLNVRMMWRSVSAGAGTSAIIDARR